MWNHRSLLRIDFRTLPILISLMIISLLVISSTTTEMADFSDETFFTSFTLKQIRWFVVGIVCYILSAGFDYRKLREFTWVLYVLILFSMIGLFFFSSGSHNVNRWYRIPIIGGTFQPSEYAKLILVMTLSWFLEYKGKYVNTWPAAFQALVIVMIPFLIVLKQPDLGTALVFYPIALVMFYFGGIKRRVVFAMSLLGLCMISFVVAMFSGILSHEEMRPTVTKFIKEYQYERLNPNTYHQDAAQTAIALGGLTGSGYRKSEFTAKKWLPAAHTDSVFSAFAEEYGLLGVLFLLLIYFGLIYFSFQVTALAKDRFGRLLSAGIAVYIAMHVIVNIGMMCGFLPITGVPLMLVTYGGSSVISTMTALGILQSIYSRRFMF